jgi:hypothetical protein
VTETAVSPVLVPTLAVALAAVHLFAENLHLRAVPRSYWLSGAGGVSVAYVFVHVLPESQAHQSTFEGATTAVEILEHHVYLLALVGFTVFYGLEQLVQRSRDSAVGDDVVTPDDAESDVEVEAEIEAETETRPGVFWVHVGTFTAYNGLVGYLLVHREEGGLASLAVFFVAMALHFVVTDHGLREDHHDAYDDVGRWILAGGVVAGLVIGLATTVTEPVVSGLFALLAGGIVLNVIKEELPERCQSNFWAFGGGAAAYAIVLLLI